ncbi:hypothetical protein [Tahibacter caeni]|uniref:hypothetical protein n=1 Tax=Tahibacter caeni TaxID=1453545 RepID=UPI0021493DD8|nr:hypothetical protein [Tahibacter caeni]
MHEAHGATFALVSLTPSSGRRLPSFRKPGALAQINSWTDWELKLDLAGNPPYAERDSRLLAYRWAGGANNELWRQNRTRSAGAAASTVGVGVDALQLHLQRRGRPDIDALDTSLQMAAAVQIDPDRSLRLQFVWERSRSRSIPSSMPR